MKKENETVLQRLVENKPIDSIGLFMQFLLLIAIIVVSIISVFIIEFKLVLETLVVLLLFTMSYNNHTLFKRKGFTILYLIAGLAIMAVTIWATIYG